MPCQALDSEWGFGTNGRFSALVLVLELLVLVRKALNKKLEVMGSRRKCMVLWDFMASKCSLG